MVFAAHPMAPETPIPFTDLDLDVLRIVLSSRRSEVTEYLHRMVGPLDESFELIAPTRRTARPAWSDARRRLGNGCELRLALPGLVQRSLRSDRSKYRSADAVVITR
jgi:hypothetical protein